MDTLASNKHSGAGKRSKKAIFNKLIQKKTGLGAVGNKESANSGVKRSREETHTKETPSKKAKSSVEEEPQLQQTPQSQQAPQTPQSQQKSGKPKTPQQSASQPQKQKQNQEGQRLYKRALEIAKQCGVAESIVQVRFKHVQNATAAPQKQQQQQQRELGTYIDHTVLKAQVQQKDVVQLCKEAAQHQFAAVCVNLSRVPLAQEQLLQEKGGSAVKIACVVGFPLGATSTSVKLFEASSAIAAGATEIDMVINIGKLMDGDYLYVFKDIENIARVSTCCKVILESATLQSEALITDACILSVLAGAHYVKTSTGFAEAGGAKPEHVSLMKRVVGDSAKVKASGGIRNREDALKYIELGADRIGTSSGVSIVSTVVAAAAEPQNGKKQAY